MWTSYHANVRNLPPELIPIRISAGNVSKVLFCLEDLIPSYELIQDFKNGKVSEGEYEQRYYNELPIYCTADYIVSKIKTTLGDNWDNAVLICYEGIGKFCYRNLVAKLLREAGYTVNEWSRT